MPADPPIPQPQGPAAIPAAVARAALIDAITRMSDAEVLELWRICGGWKVRQPPPPDPPG